MMIIKVNKCVCVCVCCVREGEGASQKKKLVLEYIIFLIKVHKS